MGRVSCPCTHHMGEFARPAKRFRIESRSCPLVSHQCSVPWASKTTPVRERSFGANGLKHQILSYPEVVLKDAMTQGFRGATDRYSQMVEAIVDWGQHSAQKPFCRECKINPDWRNLLSRAKRVGVSGQQPENVWSLGVDGVFSGP